MTYDSLRWLPIVLRSHSDAEDESSGEVICVRSKENLIVFQYFMTSALAQKAKLTVNFLGFPSVKFRKIRQTGNKYYILTGARFSEKSVKQFSETVKDISSLKSISRPIRCTIKILENFSEGGLRKSQIKP